MPSATNEKTRSADLDISQIMVDLMLRKNEQLRCRTGNQRGVSAKSGCKRRLGWCEQHDGPRRRQGQGQGIDKGGQTDVDSTRDKALKFQIDGMQGKYSGEIAPLR